MSQQQTVLRVKTNIPSATISGATEYQYLDLYDDIPIKINKSFAELQDISKKNSDFSIGLTLPSSKLNNRFFESYFNVEAQSLYFNSQKRVECSVLVDSQSYFSGYLRLNKINVINSSAEYDVTLYSEIGNLFGEIGNKLLKDLDFDDTEYTFNHTFSLSGVTALLQRSNFYKNDEQPYPYFYPIIHNGYNYETISGLTLPNVSGTTTGATLLDQTRLYTSTSPISGFTDYTGATAAGVQEYFINSPQFPLRDNQLKPALSIWNLLKLMFKEYGYTISGDFFNTPWAKSLYLYGYFSSELTKFSYKLNTIQQLPKEGVELIYSGSTLPNTPLNIIVCKRGTGVPCYCLDNINYGFANMFPYSEFGVINAGTSGKTVNAVEGFDFGFEVDGVPVADISTLRYAPKAVGTSVSFVDGDPIDFSLVIDPAMKQIDLLGSIAKKFNLVFIPNPDNVHDIIIEPYDFYMGTGTIKDWTPKLSYDKGFSVEPALNFVESTLILSDLEDQDEGNRLFKNINNRVYGWNKVDNPTDFKSEEKKIETIFSPELIRKWDNNIGLPLGLNYAASNEISSYDNQVRWTYKGIKTKPKLFFWLMGQNPFIDNVGEVFPKRPINTYTIGVQASLLTGSLNTNRYDLIPTISHTMPIGLSDENKINNDSLCILFNSEEPTDTIGVQSYNVYTENDAYSVFYKNRITNIYDPNTRFVRGFFNLNYSDIQNLNPNDIIKINEQHFIWNKVEGFNLTNKELTSVELIQFNVNPQTYPDRYFKYTYCDAPSYSFKFKTDFTNPNLLDTNYVWSIYYDNQVGSLSTSNTGFTSSFRVLEFTGVTPNLFYVPYTMQEITENEYNTSGYIDWNYDTLRNFIYSNPDTSGDGPLFSMSTFWDAGGSVTGFTGVNVWENCSGFTSTASTYGIVTGSSIYFGPPLTGSCFNYYTHFQTSGNTSGTIREVLINNDFSTYMGGTFRKYNGVNIGPTAGNSPANMIKLNYDGSVDTSFTNYGFTGIVAQPTIFVFKKQSTGKLIVGGSFNTYSGNTRNGILRLNTDGTLDTTYNSISITGGSIVDIQILSDDSIIAVGNFRLGGQTSSTSIIKLNSNGTQDTGFTINLVNSGSSINDVEVYGEQLGGALRGKIVVGGDITTWSGVSRNGIAVLNSDGTLFTTFNPGTGFTLGTVSNVEIQEDGKIIVGGPILTTYNGTTGLQGICRLNYDGTLDTTFQTNFSGTSISAVRPLYLQTGQILVPVSSTSGITITNNFYRLNNNGSIDTTFNSSTFSGPNNFSTEGSTAVQEDGTIYFGGNFQTYNGRNMWSIVKLTPDGYFIECPEEPPI